MPQVVLDLATAASTRHAVTVACPGPGTLRSRLADRNIPWISWEAGRAPGPGVGRELVALRKIVRDTGPDVVHLHASKAGLVGRLLLRGAVPTVFQPHSWSFEALSGRLVGAATAWERRASAWNDRIICVSHSEREVGERAGVVGPYAVIPNGVDLETWSAVSNSEREAARNGLAVTGPLVVCVGRLAPQKGQDVLLRAWRDLAPDPTARLALVGDGPQRSELESLAPSGVTFVGETDDVRRWIAAADLMVFPSRWEGMSLAVLEALASGRSIVATDVSGMREAMGDVGALVPADDVAALASAISQRLSDPTLRGSEERRARERAAGFDISRSLERTLDLYGEVLAGRADGRAQR